MRVRWIRGLPTLVAAGLLVAVALAPRAATAPAEPDVSAACKSILQWAAVVQQFSWTGGMGYTQPVVDGNDNLAGVSLNFSMSGYPVYGEFRHQVLMWDPAAFAPEAHTIALRSLSYGLSGYNPGATLQYDPPIVRRTAAGVAESLPGTLALDWHITGPWPYTAYSFDDPDGDHGVPIAFAYTDTTTRVPLLGIHPVISHYVCAGDSATNALTVVQSVVRSDSLSSAGEEDLLQVFRVDVPTRVGWIEIASTPTPVADWNVPSSLAVIDPQGVATPSTTLPDPMVQANLDWLYYGSSQWSKPFDFDHTIGLEPGHDYWLVMHAHHQRRLWSRHLNGDETPTFTSHIGAYWRRENATDAWTRVDAQALDFRVIGQVTSYAGVTPAAAAAQFSLRALANPAHGAALFAWSGARGALSFDVLDVRGRRVGGGEAAALAAGRWWWSALRADGAPLASGVYFVRARDASGAQVTERVVLVR